MGSSSEDEDSHKTKKPKTVYDQQRIQLEKLMANPVNKLSLSFPISNHHFQLVFVQRIRKLSFQN